MMFPVERFLSLLLFIDHKEVNHGLQFPFPFFRQ